MKYMTISDWKKREFEGSGWDNRTIKKLIAAGILKGIVNGNKSLIQADQTLSQLNVAANDVSLEQLLRESA